MYLFFMISGFLFVVGFSIILNFLYELFPINKLTKFLSPTENSIFNQITISIVPNIIWVLIEILILGSNYYFVLGFILNVFINMCIIYVIYYGYKLISNSESNTAKVVAIIFSSFFAFLVNYLALLIGISKHINIWYSLIGILIFTLIFVLIKLFPPKSEFFRGASE